MHPTQYPNINSLINKLFHDIQKVLGDKLIGFYLEGSLVLGDFDEKVSDIDLLAALSSDVNDTEFDQLREMHADFVEKHKEWNDRIEVCYISTDALKIVKSQTSPIVNISPGEPIHRLESSKKWIMNWYLTREKSITIFGPSPKDIIEPISKDEFIESVRDHMELWNVWVKKMRDRYAQAAYTILTMCRAYYAYKNGDQVSKKQAALWTQKEFPEWASLIDQAIVWRETKNEDKVDGKTYIEMESFVNFIRDKILNS
ncbi:MAG: DUF4111 domain-containing protein [Candidatus Woesebacteria bacterium]|nr:DUF4111 domain-containing protein [Candidatus Woesebacteria bacterium]